MAQDSGYRQLDEFVQNYFQDLRQDLLQVKARLEDLQGKLDQRLEHIAKEPFLQSASGGAVPSANGEAVFSDLARALQSFGAAADEESVLEALASFGNRIAPRVLVLVRRGDRWVRFAQGKLDTATSFASDAQTIYQKAAESRSVVAEESARFSGHGEIHQVLGGDAHYCAAVPLLFGDAVPAVFYADTPQSKTLNVPALEVLCQGARLAIRALHHTELPAEAVSQPEARKPQPIATPAPPQPAVSPARTPAAPSAPSEDSIDFSRDILGRRQREWGRPATEERPAAAAAEPPRAAETAIPPAPAATASPMPGTPYAPVPQPYPEPAAPVQERTAPAPQPPPPVFAPVPQAPAATSPAAAAPAAQKVPGPQLSSDEERQHADARRFARLLVSELKLYNEQAVVQGRRNRDIYARLKQDIERSREMYNRRVPVGVTRRQDYFHEELVKLLAEGDMESLGRDYPGPQAARA
ncbi:MAG TPA: hypothetical protein VGK99_20985 [Acidobacteriota bacterium]|jgi:hypothetical protein